MNICLIMDNPETPRHPVIAVALQKLSVRHSVRFSDVRSLTGQQAVEQEATYPQADLYLLKSHAPQALELAQYLEHHGAQVVNSWSSSVACQDRVLMSQRMQDAHLPWPNTRFFTSLAVLLEQANLAEVMSYPCIIKSHYSHRNDLVEKIDTAAELAALAPTWNNEPIVIQDFTASDGWDIKLWVIDQKIFAARRRTPLEPGAAKEDIPLQDHELPDEWIRIVRQTGHIFDLRLYGVDLLISEQGPVVVDVNSFPGFRGVPGADDALVDLVEKIDHERLNR